MNEWFIMLPQLKLRSLLKSEEIMNSQTGKISRKNVVFLLGSQSTGVTRRLGPLTQKMDSGKLPRFVLGAPQNKDLPSKEQTL